MNAFLYVLLCLIWGSTWAAIKFALAGVPPFLGAGLRFTLASAVLAPIALARPRRALVKNDWIVISSCGFLSFTFCYATVYWSEQYISSGLAAILYCTMPLFTALISAATGAETLTGRKAAGIFTGMAGTAILFWPDGAATRGQLAGMLATLAGSLVAAGNLVTMKRYGKHTDVFVLNAISMAIAGSCLLALSRATEAAAPRWTGSNVAALFFLSLVGTVTAFAAYYHLIKTMEATKLSLITFIAPVVAVGVGYAALGEKVTWTTAAGIAVVFAGVTIAGLRD